MMKKLCFFLLTFVMPFVAYCQPADYTNSGYTSLTIKFSGKYPKDKPISTPLFYNVFVSNKPLEFKQINDSTMLMSYYTFGPSLFWFVYNSEYCRSVLLPNHSDVLTIHYKDSTKFTIDYEGIFKEAFTSSKEYAEVVKEALFTGPYFVNIEPSKDANSFRNVILKESQRMIAALVKSIPSEMRQEEFRYDMEAATKYYYLFRDYGLRAYTEVKTDSDTIKIPFERDISFYHGLNLSSHANIERLISPPNDLYKIVRQDSLLNLPNIRTSNPETYLSKLKAIFDFEVKDSKSLFYDLMIAGAYMDHINIGTALSETQRLDILKFFKNKQISNYILYHNDMIAKKTNQGAKQYYLSYDQLKESVLQDILLRYKGKVVVVDVWATWCGPCIEASGKIKKVKEQYSEDDVAFVYLTNESSDQNQWKEFADFIGGEHYYLYNNQYKKINKQFSIETIPSYLIFGKDGQLEEKNLGGYMGNDKLIEWIERGLKK